MSPQTDKVLIRDDIAGVILAGGASSRMGGGDKGLRSIAGQPILARIVARLRPQVGALALNANGDATRFAEFHLPVIADIADRRDGPLAGVLAGLTWAAQQARVKVLVTVSSDVPFLPLDLVPRLAGVPALRVARSGGCIHPTIALWPLAIAPALADALSSGHRKATAFVEAQGAEPVDFPSIEVAGRSVDPFFNTNTPEDLDAARNLLQSSAP